MASEAEQSTYALSSLYPQQDCPGSQWSFVVGCTVTALGAWPIQFIRADWTMGDHWTPPTSGSSDAARSNKSHLRNCGGDSDVSPLKLPMLPTPTDRAPFVRPRFAKSISCWDYFHTEQQERKIQTTNPAPARIGIRSSTPPFRTEEEHQTRPAKELPPSMRLPPSDALMWTFAAGR
jgi:hypothetical protein